MIKLVDELNELIDNFEKYQEIDENSVAMGG